MRGHVRLDGRHYMLASERSITRSNANQVAAKISQGAGEYDDLQNWSNWLMNDWRAGGGKKDPSAGGFLFSTIDSRFSGQLSLPGLLRHTTFFNPAAPPPLGTTGYTLSVDDVSSTPSRSDVTIGAGQAIERLGNTFVVPSAAQQMFEFLLPGQDEGTNQVTVEIRFTSAGLPTTLAFSTTIDLAGRPGWFWHFWNLPDLLSVGTTFAVTIRPTSGTITLPAIELAGSAANLQNDGTSWSASSTYGWIARWHAGWGNLFDPLPVTVTDIVRFGSKTYLAVKNKILSYDGEVLALVDDTSTLDYTDLLATGDRLFLARGGTQQYWHMNVAETITKGTNATPAAQLFLLWRGFLWRSSGVNLFYTGDETIWTTIEVADRGYQIRGLGGYGDDVIVSTDNALYRVTWGDLVQELTTWGRIDPANGAHMHQFQGDLYISHGPGILRYDGNLLPVGPDLGEGLPEYFAGPVVGFASNNNWLLCAVAGEVSSVWIYNGQGWHFGAELPYGVTISAISYVNDDDNGFSEFLIGTEENSLYSLRIADSLTAMRRVTDATSGTQYHQWTGFLETDWFYGSLREVRKDIESVYLDGEHLGGHGENHCSIYWQDELSTDWELLGHVNSDETELRFTNEGRRPASHRIKLGILLYNNFHLHTPVVSAIRLKFRPMLIDRWRWQFPIVVHDRQQMLDGDINTYSSSQMITHLDNLTKQVPPLRFMDTDGVEYEVMVLTSSRQVDKFEWLPHAARVDIHHVYQMTIEQVFAGTGYIGILDPTELPSLWGWWDFSDASTLFTTGAGNTNVTVDGNLIGRIEDKSGGGRHARAGSDGARPVYKTGVRNLLSAALMNGSKHLVTTETIDTSNMTLCAVAITDTLDDQDSRGLIGAMRVSDADGGSVRMDMGPPIKFIGRTSPTNLNISISDQQSTRPDTPYIVSYTIRGVTGLRRLSVNGGFVKGVADVTSGSRAVILGESFSDSPFFGWKGHLLEMVAFSPALTDEQYNLLLSYLNNKWRVFQL